MEAFVDNGGIRIGYQALGSGRPLVLLHGYSLDSQAWQDMGYVEPLIEAGFRPILIDIRGHGASGKPHDPGAYTEEQQAGDVAAVLNALGIERSDLMGYSRGGRMALDFARLFPERTDRLVIGGAHPFVQDLSLFRAAVAGGIEGWIGVIEHVAVDRPDVSSSFQGFPRPCLFFAGTDDPLRSQIERAAGLLPHGRMVEIRGCNHMTALQRVNLVLPPVLQFLAEGRRL
jgi:pimeloyl-ACP methyl ester carboxylesterase